MIWHCFPCTSGNLSSREEVKNEYKYPSKKWGVKTKIPSLLPRNNIFCLVLQVNQFATDPIQQKYTGLHLPMNSNLGNTKVAFNGKIMLNASLVTKLGLAMLFIHYNINQIIVPNISSTTL